MKVSYKHESVRLTGRWDITNPAYAETTTTGSYVEFSFQGKTAVACFDIEANALPLLHLWIQVDNGAMAEAPIDRYLRVVAPTEGTHIVRIIYKGGTECDRRWYLPLTGKVSFIGIQTQTPIALENDTRKTIEFVGDSITEGVLIDTDYCEGTEPPFYRDQSNRVYQDDVCATYAWLTAERLNLRPIFMGYGAVGVTRSGQGIVPAAPLAYPYNFENSPVSRPQPDIVVINHGANDGGRPAEEYVKKYGELLDIVRSMNPKAKVVALSAFCGKHHEALGQYIQSYNQRTGVNVTFIDSTGWISPEPLHPHRDGHTTVADHLTPILEKLI